MKIYELTPATGAKKTRKRIGRGPGSGHGKTACRGHKGQRSRSGGGPRPGFEGGQMPLHRRLPKRGFTNIFKKCFEVVNVGDLERFSPDSRLDIEDLEKAGLVKRRNYKVKLLGNGDISYPVFIRVHGVSATAKQKIEDAGGKVELI